MIDPHKSYWSQMPTLMKICAPLTAAMIAVGAALMAAGVNDGIILVGTPILIIGLRLFLLFLLEIGPQSIFGYTYDYWSARTEAAYALPRGTITIVLVVLFIAFVIVMVTFSP